MDRAYGNSSDFIAIWTICFGYLMLTPIGNFKFVTAVNDALCHM